MKRRLAKSRQRGAAKSDWGQRNPIEPCYAKIGAVIKQARHRKGLRQQAFATALGWGSRAAISNLEKGRQRVRVHDLLRIAEILGVPISDLLDPEWTGSGSKRHEPKPVRLLGNSRKSRRR